MKRTILNPVLFTLAFLTGLGIVAWIGAGFFASANQIALTVTALIGLIYVVGAVEMALFRRATATLRQALASAPVTLDSLDRWLEPIHPSLSTSVRARIEGERVGLPGPALTPYLVGLLVMVGMLGTFLGMVVTLNGAVLALEGTTELEAIRAGLAAPIKGLGLAFGTSVAGVAASAILGLIAALGRRERLQAVQVLDQKIMGVLRRFSLTHHRQETFKSLQRQTQALPDLVDRLQTMAAQMERTSQQVNDRLLANQESFHATVQGSFGDLARSVETSLKESLAASGRLAGESLKPIVTDAMTEIAQTARTTQAILVESMQTQLEGLAGRFSHTTGEVAQHWREALSQHQQANQSLVQDLGGALTDFNQTFAQRSTALLDTWHETALSARAEQAASDQQRLAQWRDELASQAASLHRAWREAGEQNQAQQKQICATLASTAEAISASAEANASRLLADVSQLLSQSEALARSRIATEEAWVTEQGQRMEQLAQMLRQELGTLRDDEAIRGEAAVARLATLQAALADHLATLGAALEAPMTRLIEAASEAPRAAAEVISQLRQEMANHSARDNQLLDERTRIMAGLDHLLSTLNQGTTEQRAAVESLVHASSDMLKAVGSEFQAQVGTETAKLSGLAAQVTGSAVEVASLSEAFATAVQQFGQSNDKLVDTLNHIESALEKSSTRSDEQLAYYVAQARELIDLSLLSQKAVVEEFRQIQAKPERPKAGAA